MDNQQNTQKQYEKELEIDLIDYLRVIWQRKKEILTILLAIVIITAIASFVWPKTYQSSALLEIGKIGENYLESPEDTAALFKRENTLRLLAEKINIPETKWTKLLKTVKIQPVNKFLEIKVEEETPQKAKNIVNQVVNLILERHQKILNKQKEILNKEIEEIKNNLKQSENRTTEIEKELKKFKNPKTEAEGLIYLALLSAFNQEKQNIINFKQVLLDKELELKNYISLETRIELPARETLKPIKPKKLSNILVSVVIGLFIGIFYAFIAEYFEKNKAKFS